MSQLKNLEVVRSGNLVAIKWDGAPRFSIGVLSTLSEADALDRAAAALEDESSRPGFAAEELRTCVKEIRKRAAALRVAEGEV